MKEDTVFDYLLGKLDKQAVNISETVLKGELSEAEYRRLGGMLHGIRYAYDLIADTAHRLANDEEFKDDE